MVGMSGSKDGSFYAGLEDLIFDPVRFRDGLLIVLAAAGYWGLVWWARKRLVLDPTLMVLQEEWRALQDADTRATSATPSGLAKKKGDARVYWYVRELQTIRAVRERERLQSMELPALKVVAAGLAGRAPHWFQTLTTASQAPQRAECRLAIVQAQEQLAEEDWRAVRKVLRFHRKILWLTGAGLLLLVALVLCFGNPALVAFGALGAVISRIVLLVQQAQDEEQRFHWGSLMLSPVSGGLAGWAGVLIVDVAQNAGLLGETFEGVQFNEQPASTATVATAFVFGFVERLLERITTKTADGLLPAETAKADAANLPPDPVGGNGNGDSSSDLGSAALRRDGEGKEPGEEQPTQTGHAPADDASDVAPHRADPAPVRTLSTAGNATATPGTAKPAWQPTAGRIKQQLPRRLLGRRG